MTRYQPPRVKTSYDRVKGIAKVQLGKTGNIRVNFKDGPVFTINADNVQAEPVWAGVAFCECSENGQIFFSMRPHKGLFKGRCIGISSSEDEIPAPAVKTGKFGEFMVFYSIFEITEGKYKGCKYPSQIPYKFVDADGVAALPGERGKSRYTDQLEDYMYITGAWETELEFSENLLPEINRRIKNAGKTFMFSVKDGYVDQLIDAETEDETSGSDDDEGWADEE